MLRTCIIVYVYSFWLMYVFQKWLVLQTRNVPNMPFLGGGLEHFFPFLRTIIPTDQYLSEVVEPPNRFLFFEYWNMSGLFAILPFDTCANPVADQFFRRGVPIKNVNLRAKSSILHDDLQSLL